MIKYHTPVLLKEIIENLEVKPGKKYIDATVGGGGHTLKILEAGGIVLGIDQDQEALDYTASVIPKKYQDRLCLVKGNFRNIQKIAVAHKFEKVSGILLDLGISSHQLNTSSRGFSFRKSGPLDMRMDQQEQRKAFDLINFGSKEEIVQVLIKFGEEPKAQEIAQQILFARKKEEITDTIQLAEIIEDVYRGKRISTHPATKTFQAIRIWVNQELDTLKIALNQVIALLDQSGRLLVISFHSLEDRITKLTFNNWEKTGRIKIINKKPLIPSFQEIKVNPRARSAKLRMIEKL